MSSFPGQSTYAASDEAELANKYSCVSAELVINNELIRIERRWQEAGAKSKVFVEDEPLSAKDFQQWLLEKLSIPLLNFPKGNPMSGQTWPELSFRILLRHIYRQQRFWSGIADQQPEGEQHASILQFLGLAERVYSPEYGELISLRMQVEKLKSRRENFGQTMDELASDLIGDKQVVKVTPVKVQESIQRLTSDIDGLQNERNNILARESKNALPPEKQSYIASLGELRAQALVDLEELRRKFKATFSRAEEIARYTLELEDEAVRLGRAEDAGMILSDLKVTHCPACDQAVDSHHVNPDECFLCHQQLPDIINMKELGVARLQFEGDRLLGELKESKDLLGALRKETSNQQEAIENWENSLRQLDQQLAPAREAVAALAQEDVSAIDVAIGQCNERINQLRRVASALEVGTNLSAKIDELERLIAPLQQKVENLLDATDFEARATLLEDGMNNYLNALNQYRPDVWRHNPVTIDLSKSSISFKVGRRRWNSVLGGTDTLYFLMAYHYGLLSLSNQKACHYPGLSIIDLPGEFLGEAIEDKENFIVQPFIDLVSQENYDGAQLVMTGASFSGLKGAHIQQLTHVHVAK